MGFWGVVGMSTADRHAGNLYALTLGPLGFGNLEPQVEAQG